MDIGYDGLPCLLIPLLLTTDDGRGWDILYVYDKPEDYQLGPDSHRYPLVEVTCCMCDKPGWTTTMRIEMGERLFIHYPCKEAGQGELADTLKRKGIQPDTKVCERSQ